MAQAQQLPETLFEQQAQKARDRDRLDRQKMLVSLPRGKESQEYLASTAGKSVELREDIENLLLMVKEVETEALKNRLIQGTRTALEKATKLHTMSVVAAKDGMDTAQKVFCPAPTYTDLGEDQQKMLEKIRKEEETAKKKGAANSEKTGWN